MKTTLIWKSMLSAVLFLCATLFVTLIITSCSDDSATPAPPTVSSFSPPSALVGEDITISGTNLNTVTKVEFGTIVATIKSKSKEQMVVEVPPGAATSKIVLKYAAGHITTEQNFTVSYRTIWVSDFEEDNVETAWGISEDATEIEVSSFVEAEGNTMFKLKGQDKNANYWVGGRYKGTGNPETYLGIEEPAAAKVFFNFDIRSNQPVTAGLEPLFKPVFYVYDATAGNKKKNWECDIKVGWSEWKTVSISADKFRRWDGGFVNFSGDIRTLSEVALYLTGGTDRIFDFSIDNVRFSEGAPLGEVITPIP